ncbi:MAG: hypothetical protein M1133_11530 [Armatimonadetes bacterium]|nr:hypothetical protein [Armatimonadota bacterium]
MNKTQAEEDIRLIREVMERSAKCTNFSGVSGIVAGMVSLAGCYLTWWATMKLPPAKQPVWYIVIWVSAFVIAVGQDSFLAARKAKRAGLTYFGPATWQLYKAVFPGVFVAFVISVVAFSQGSIDPIPAIWALGYGTALCAAGMFTVKEVRTFGVIQLITGAVGLVFFTEWYSSLYLLAVSMGLYHIIFGLWLTRKYGW